VVEREPGLFEIHQPGLDGDAPRSWLRSVSSKTGGYMPATKACAGPGSRLAHRLAASLADLLQNLGNELLLTVLGCAGADAETVIVLLAHGMNSSAALPSPAEQSTPFDQCGRGLRAAHGTLPHKARAAPTHVQTRLSTRRSAASFYLALRLTRSLTRPAQTVRLRLSARVKHRSRRPWCKRCAARLHEERYAALHVHGVFPRP
jgi:hypothetical protein